jgi:hypothetical protein
MRTLRIVAIALTLGAVLTACGPQGSGEDPAPGSTGDTTVPTSPSTPSAPPPSGDPSGAASPKAGGTTLTGTVTSGVEPGCFLLDGYLLVGGPQEVIRAGARVTVTGEVKQDMMTTCQQGTPFQVATARPA